MMSENTKPRRNDKQPRVQILEIIDDPAELERLSAMRTPDDGTAMMVSAVMMVVEDGQQAGRPRSYVNGIMGIAELLTPEQQVELATRLPALLSNAALERLAEEVRQRLAAPRNGPT